ncbi:hypothetical protein L6452_17712 [Arctium lappa]|uniref:Uncharacterized protein n=1 Tax=Arctium lappa TaxID=4217 RepID=A0ACB9C4D0_ARCLA|nr:hypothetical protein L6452_17712 [Arctium lappa]
MAQNHRCKCRIVKTERLGFGMRTRFGIWKWNDIGNLAWEVTSEIKVFLGASTLDMEPAIEVASTMHGQCRNIKRCSPDLVRIHEDRNNGDAFRVEKRSFLKRIDVNMIPPTAAEAEEETGSKRRNNGAAGDNASSVDDGDGGTIYGKLRPTANIRQYKPNYAGSIEHFLPHVGVIVL